MREVKSKTYTIFKNILRMAYLSDISASQTVDLVIDFIAELGIKLRKPEHKLAAIHYITTDLTNFSADTIASLALGLIYIKPDNTATQDFYIFKPNSDEYEHLKSDHELKNKYPRLHGGHKRKLRINDFQL